MTNKKRELMKIGERYTETPYTNKSSTDQNYYQNTYEVIGYLTVADYPNATPYLTEEVRLVKKVCLGMTCPST